MQDLTAYMSKSIEKIMNDALKIAFKNPKELFFLLHFYKAQKKAAKIRENSETKNLHIPPFLIASIVTECNLHCAGCYSRANEKNKTIEQVSNKTCNAAAEQLPAQRWKQLFAEAERLGICFILLAGGEPLLRLDVLDFAKDCKNILFPVFTNGTLINDKYIDFFEQNRNMLPIFSLEGGQQLTDARRGEGVYEMLCKVMQKLQQKNILFGISITVTKENIKEITEKNFVSNLANKGCSLIFYVEYVPADGKSASLAPTDTDREYLAERVNRIRETQPLIAITFPGDEQEFGGCLAAGRGFFHISAAGNAEPCPFSPYSDLSLKDCSLMDALQSPLFKKLQSSELLQAQHSGGCVLFGQDEAVRAMAE